jgi:hypothetical protein
MEPLSVRLSVRSHGTTLRPTVCPFTWKHSPSVCPFTWNHSPFNCLSVHTEPLSTQLCPFTLNHTVRSRASCFKWQYPVLSLMLSSSFLRLLLHLPVTSIPPFTFPSITCCRRQFLHKMWPIQLPFRVLIPCTIFLCTLTLSNTYFLIWLESEEYFRYNFV